MPVLPLLLLLALAAALAPAPAQAAGPPRPGAERCVAAARIFLEGLVDTQRQRAVESWNDPARLKPMFPPGSAPAPTGIRIGELTDGQRMRLHDFLACGLSSQGHQKVMAIIRRGDLVQATAKTVPAQQRETPAETSSLHFWITLFGEPSADRPFAWRFEGHHLALNFTVEKGELRPGPMWIGADPAVMTKTLWAGFRVLDTEFARGLELLESLTPEQQRRAVTGTTTPLKMRFTPGAKGPRPPPGLPLAALDAGQQRLFWRLVEEYLRNVEASTAERLLAQLAARDPAQLAFAWEGPLTRGAPVSYRVQGQGLEIEFSHALGVTAPQKGLDLNHIHTWWQVRPAGAPARP